MENSILENNKRNQLKTFSIKPYVKLVIILFVVVLFISCLICISKISAKNHLSFLPDVKMGMSYKSSETTEAKELSNQWYRLKVANNGNVQVDNLYGEAILSNLSFYYEYLENEAGNQLHNIAVSQLNDSVITIFGSMCNDVRTKIALTVCQNRPRMEVTVQTSYQRNVTVLRESLIAEFESRASEVYLKNSDIESKHLSKEYWVDKQGVRFGESSTSALIYHTPDVSSVQLKSRDNLLFVNLDYYMDHPSICIPFQEGGEGKWIDISASQYKAGDERINTFSLHFGYVPEVLPRLMLVPGGYLAGYIFTEHADGGNIRTHRAAYFGSENVTNPLDAKTGFCGHQIPVTKSIFYDELSVATVKRLDSVKTEVGYLAFLDQLHALGNDLCLHTPEEGNSTRISMKKALTFMRDRYDSRSWIDHGMYSGNNNRESMSAEGLDPISQYYAGDLWQEFNIRYFWSPAVEALRFANPRPSLKQSLHVLKLKTLSSEFWSRYNFLRIYECNNTLEVLRKLLQGNFPMLELNSQRPIMGHSYPTPLYWQYPRYSDQFYSWPTEFDYNGVTRHLDHSNLVLEKRHIDQLIEKRGVFYNHGYYVRNDVHDEILTSHEGELRVNPYFDSVLIYLDQKHDEGNLLLTTVRDLLDYRLLIENVVLDYKPDGSIDIINNNHHEVKDLSLAVRINPEDISLRGTEYCYRQVDDDTIIWFNIPAETAVCLTIKRRDKANAQYFDRHNAD